MTASRPNDCGLPMAPAPAEPIAEQAESAWLELAAGHATVAETQARQVLSSISAGKAADYQRDHAAQATLVLGQALLADGHAREALPLLEQAVALHRAVYDPQRSPAMAEAWSALADARRAAGDANATAADEEARRIRSRTPR